MQIGKQTGTVKFSRLRISTKVLQKYFTKIENGAPNSAYQAEGYEDIVFMAYGEEGEEYITLLDKKDY